MKILCDTHALLFAIREPHRLSDRARELFEDASVELVASSVSAFEIATKSRIGKLDDAELLVQDYSGFLARLGASQLDIRQEHALWAGSLNWAHRDPFDRMLAAQAMVEHVPLVTSDRAFETMPGLSTIW